MATTVVATPAQELLPEKIRHRSTLIAPQDAYWESGIIGAATHYRIEVDGHPAGFCAVDDEGFLVQWFIDATWMPVAGEVMTEIATSVRMRGAYASTTEPTVLSLCLDRQKGVSVDTLLYFDHHTVPSSGLNSLRLASMNDLPGLMAMQESDPSADLATMDANFGGLAGYLRAVIADESILVLEEAGEIVGSGDFRLREAWPGTADLGVVVAPHRRGEGIGTEILCLLKEMAATRTATPMCSTTVENLGAQRIIEKSGMVATHRILRIEF